MVEKDTKLVVGVVGRLGKDLEDKDNCLCTNDFYGYVRNGFDAGKCITRAIVRGGP